LAHVQGLDAALARDSASSLRYERPLIDFAVFANESGHAIDALVCQPLCNRSMIAVDDAGTAQANPLVRVLSGPQWFFLLLQFPATTLALEGPGLQEYEG
jgi:hypothetical protein